MELEKVHSFWKNNIVYSALDIYRWIMIYEKEIEHCLVFDEQNEIPPFYICRVGPKLDLIKFDIARAYSTLKKFTIEYKDFESRAQPVLEEYFKIDKSKNELLNYFQKHFRFVYIDVAVFFFWYSGLEIGGVPQENTNLELNITSLKVRIKIKNSCCPNMVKLLKVFSSIVDNKLLEPEVSAIIQEFKNEDC